MISLTGGVLCCGNIVQDIVVQPVGEIVYDRSTWVDSIQLSPGGNGANTAYAIARLGTPVRLLSYAGADEFGDGVIRRLAAAGVDVDRVVRSPEAPTATSVVLVNPTGGRALLHRPGVSRVAFREPPVLDDAGTRGMSHFHLANPFGLVEMRRLAGEVLAAARTASQTTSLDTGWDSRGEWMSVIGPCLPYLDLLFVNEEEARMLSGLDDPGRSAAFFMERGAGAVVIKQGAKGCSLFEPAVAMTIPAFGVVAIDTTGAGDCFAGGFLSALYRGFAAADAARFANAVGALSVTALGAADGLLGFDETLAWMEAQPSA